MEILSTTTVPQNFSRLPSSRRLHSTATTAVQHEEKSDLFFLISVVTPLVFCCFAIFLCALNSVWKTRKKLEEMNKAGRPEPSEYTEFTIDLTTKVDSCVELSSAQDSVLL